MNVGLRRSLVGWRKSPGSQLSLNLGFFICQQGRRGSQLLGFARHGWGDKEAPVCPLRLHVMGLRDGQPCPRGPHLLPHWTFLPASMAAPLHTLHVDQEPETQKGSLLSGSPELGSSELAISELATSELATSSQT